MIETDAGAQYCFGRPGRLFDLKALPDRIAVGEELLHERFVDDRHLLRRCVIDAIVERAARQHWRFHRLEIVGAHGVEIGMLLLLFSVDEDVVVPSAATHRHDERLRGGLNAGERCQTRRDLLEGGRQLFGDDAGASQIEAGDDDLQKEKKRDDDDAEPPADGRTRAGFAQEAQECKHDDGEYADLHRVEPFKHFVGLQQAAEQDEPPG